MFKVWSGRLGRPVALKLMLLDHEATKLPAAGEALPGCVDDLVSEFGLMLDLAGSCPNVWPALGLALVQVQPERSRVQAQMVALVMEWSEHGDLDGFLNHMGDFLSTEVGATRSCAAMYDARQCCGPCSPAWVGRVAVHTDCSRGLQMLSGPLLGRRWRSAWAARWTSGWRSWWWAWAGVCCRSTPRATSTGT